MLDTLIFDCSKMLWLSLIPAYMGHIYLLLLYRVVEVKTVDVSLLLLQDAIVEVNTVDVGLFLLQDAIVEVDTVDVGHTTLLLLQDVIVNVESENDVHITLKIMFMELYNFENSYKGINHQEFVTTRVWVFNTIPLI